MNRGDAATIACSAVFVRLPRVRLPDGISAWHAAAVPRFIKGPSASRRRRRALATIRRSSAASVATRPRRPKNVATRPRLPKKRAAAPRRPPPPPLQKRTPGRGQSSVWTKKSYLCVRARLYYVVPRAAPASQKNQARTGFVSSSAPLGRRTSRGAPTDYRRRAGSCSPPSPSSGRRSSSASPGPRRRRP